jgi:hypothetical protein
MTDELDRLLDAALVRMTAVAPPATLREGVSERLAGGARRWPLLLATVGAVLLLVALTAVLLRRPPAQPQQARSRGDVPLPAPSSAPSVREPEPQRVATVVSRRRPAGEVPGAGVPELPLLSAPDPIAIAAVPVAQLEVAQIGFSQIVLDEITVEILDGGD